MDNKFFPTDLRIGARLSGIRMLNFVLVLTLLTGLSTATELQKTQDSISQTTTSVISHGKNLDSIRIKLSINGSDTKLDLPGLGVDMNINIGGLNNNNNNNNNNNDTSTNKNNNNNTAIDSSSGSKNSQGDGSTLRHSTTESFQNQMDDTGNWKSKEICLYDEIDCTGDFYNAWLGDPEDCTKFFICQGKKLYHRSCPDNQKYDYIRVNCSLTVPPGHCQKKCKDTPHGSDRYKSLIVDESEATSQTESTVSVSTNDQITSTQMFTTVTELNLSTTLASSTSNREIQLPSTPKWLSSTSDMATNTVSQITELINIDKSLMSSISQESTTVDAARTEQGTSLVLGGFSEVTVTKLNELSSPVSVFDVSTTVSSVAVDVTTSIYATVSSSRRVFNDLPIASGSQTSQTLSTESSSNTDTSTSTEGQNFNTPTNTQVMSDPNTESSLSTDKIAETLSIQSTASDNKTTVQESSVSNQAQTETQMSTDATQLSDVTTLYVSTVPSPTVNPFTVPTSKDSCVLPFPCILDEVRANPEDCSVYFICVQFSGESTTQWLWRQCPSQMSFNETSGNCSVPLNNETCGYVCPTSVEHSISLIPEQTKTGDRQEIICSFRVVFLLRQIQLDQVTWYINNIQITPSNGRKTRFNFKRSGPDNTGQWNETFIINPAKKEDSGVIRCDVTYGGVGRTSTASRPLSVSLLPQAMILPPSLTVYEGDNVTLTCSALLDGAQISSSDVTFQWFYNGKPSFLSITEDEVVIRDDNFSGKSQLDFVAHGNVSVTISCIVENNGLTSVSDVTVVRIIQRPGNTSDGGVVGVCKPDHSAGVDWPVTLANSESVQSCSQPYIGEARRQCDRAGGWRDTDISDCLSSDVRHLTEKIESLENGIGIENMESVSNLTSLIFNQVKSSPHMSDNTSGDFQAIVHILERLTDLRKTVKRVSRQEVTDVMQTVSKLLEIITRRPPEFNVSSADSAISLMQTVEVYGKLWAQNLTVGFSDSFVNDYLAVQVQANRRISLDNVSYPQRSESADWFSKIDQITLYQSTNQSAVKRSTIQSESSTERDEVQYVSSTYFRNLHDYMPRILSLSVDEMQETGNEVIVVLEAVKNFSDAYKPTCVFWDYGIGDRGDWSSRGCNMMNDSLTKSHVTCQCDHLTNFAILMSPSAEIEGNHEAILSIISMIGCIISIVSLSFTILLYAIRWAKVKSHQAVVIINLCIALIVGNVIFLAGADKTSSEVGCKVVAALLHFFFLAAFFLMLVEGILLLLYVIFVFHHRRKRETALLVFAAWLIPLIVVGISLGATLTVGYGADDGRKSCWLSLKGGVLWAFVAPALLIICTNIVILIVVVWQIFKVRKRILPNGSHQRIRETLWNVAALTPVLGIMWVFGVLSVNHTTVAFQYIFTIANAFQGLFIFIFHGLCNQRNNRNRYEVKNKKKNSSKKRADREQQELQPRIDKDDIIHVVIMNSPPVESNSNNNQQSTFTLAEQSEISNSSSFQDDSDFNSVDTGTSEVTSESRDRKLRLQTSA